MGNPNPLIYSEIVAIKVTREQKKALEHLKQLTDVPTSIRLRRAVERVIEEDYKTLADERQLTLLSEDD